MPLDHELTFTEWLETTNYPEARKVELTKVYDMLAGRPPTAKQCSRIQSFIKTESYPEFKAPRWINSRSDAFKVYSGPFFKAIEQVLYARPEYIKHVPVCERPARIQGLERAGRRYYGTDFTAFESSFSPEVLRAVECQLYRHMLGRALPSKTELVCRTISGLNRLRTRAGVTVEMQGRRMSGDMCTSLGNGFTNYMLWAYLCEQRNIPSTAWEGLVEGDDGLFALNAEYAPPAVQDYAQLGFSIKVENAVSPGLANFCGFVSVEGVNVKNPVEVMAGFGWTLTQPMAGPRRLLELQRAKALSLAYEMPGCPILQAAAQRGLAVTRGLRAHWVADGYKAPVDESRISFKPVPQAARLLVASRWGISVASQLAAEKALAAGDLQLVVQLLGTTPASPDMFRYQVFT